MFGYVTTEKGELKVKEYEAYRGLYCSLCRALGKRYGLFSRLILSYDATFLAVLTFAEQDEAPSFKPGRCPFNPTKRCNYCMNGEDLFDSVCAAAILMFYYKVRDNLSDGGFFGRLAARLLLPYAALKRRKAMKIYPEAERWIYEAMKTQREAEAKGSASFDEAAHPSADALGKLAAQNAKKNPAAYYKLGYFLGRWVYLMDAANDMKRDIKTGDYNVFVQAFSLKDANLDEEQLSQIRQTLNASAGMAADALEESGCEIMKPILKNILYDGTYRKMEQVLKGDEANERSL